MRIKSKLSKITLTVCLYPALGCTPEPPKSTLSMMSKIENAILCPSSGNFSEASHEVLFADSHYEALQKVFDGDSDFAAANTPSIFNFYINNPKSMDSLIILSGVASVQNSFALLTRENSKIDKPKNLAGKTIGHLGDKTRFFKSYFLQTEGLLTKGTKEKIAATSDDLIQYLETKIVDAVIVPTETVYRLSGKKYNMFFSKLHEVTTQIVTTKKFLNEHPKQIRSFFKSLIKTESNIYNKTNAFTEQALNCIEKLNLEQLQMLIENKSFRILLDKSLLTQYELYKQWNLSVHKEDSDTFKLIRSIEIGSNIERIPLTSVDRRRVLIR